MIYVSKGFETNQLTEIESDKDDFQTVVDSKVQVFSNIDELESVKRYEAYYFLAGELSKPIRKNEHVMNKSLVTLDYDGLEMTEQEFKKHLLGKVNSLKWLAYPSIRHGLLGTRYRVIIPTDRPYSKEESTRLIQFITSHIDLPYDEASKVWSQPMGLKVTFESIEAFNGKCIYNEGKGVYKVDNALEKMAERKPEKKQKPAFTVNYTRNRTYTAELLERILEPIEDGERNVKLTSLIGKLFSLGMNAEAVYEWIHIINDNFVTPVLSEDEVNKVFRSILKAEQSKLGRGG